MTKKNSRYHFERLILIAGSFLSIAALAVVVFASQKPTSTASHASGGCIMTPKISLGKTEGGEKSVTYYLRVDNKSDVSCKKNIRYVVAKQTINAIWLLEYFDEFGNMVLYKGQPANATPFGLIYPSSREKFSVKIFPPLGLRKGEYIIPVKVCRSTVDTSDPDYNGYESYLSNITTDCSKVSLKYVKE